MSVWEIVLLGAALAMDAVAVGLVNGMSDSRMKLSRAAETAGAFGLFQFFMPLVGYALGAAFAGYAALVAPALSFLILVFLGGKMILGCVKEMRSNKAVFQRGAPKDDSFKLFFQAVATSIDALAVGITLLALEESGTLALSVLLSSVVIGVVTFVLVLIAVFAGKKIGTVLADKAEILGGCVLIAIGIKILLESV